MANRILVKCAGATVAAIMTAAVSSAGALAWGGGNSITETGPGSVNVISSESSSRYAPYSSYGSMNSYAMQNKCEYGQSYWMYQMCRSHQAQSIYMRPTYQMSNYSTRPPCDYSSTGYTGWQYN